MENNNLQWLDIKQEIKNKYKNYLNDGARVYYSKQRPINQILNFLSEKENIEFINENIIITPKPLNNKEIYQNDLKEFCIEFMDIGDNNFLITDYCELFDLNCYNLNDLLRKYKANIKHIAGMFKDCITREDYNNKVQEILKEYGGEPNGKQNSKMVKN